MAGTSSVFRAVEDLALKHGWKVEKRTDGRDLFDKLLSLSSVGSNRRIYIDKSRGVSKAGDIKHFRIYVHPDKYDEALVSAARNVAAGKNQQTKKNRFSHSGFQGFPVYPDNREPCAMAYEAKGYMPLDWLLVELRR